MNILLIAILIIGFIFPLFVSFLLIKCNKDDEYAPIIVLTAVLSILPIVNLSVSIILFILFYPDFKKNVFDKKTKMNDIENNIIKNKEYYRNYYKNLIYNGKF